MNEFISDLGFNNLLVIAAIVSAIVLALIIIVIIEKIQNRKEYELEHYKEPEEETIYYKENVTEEEAKKKLDDAYEKLSLEESSSDLISHTNFEEEQEEKSVISYDELIKVSNDVDQRNDLLLKDEGTEPITIEELYNKHLEEQTTNKLDNPVFEEEVNDDKKFKNSLVISPVFGVYKNINKTKYATEDLEKTVDLEDLEVEIKKTEEFLRELKKLKNKLD